MRSFFYMSNFDNSQPPRIPLPPDQRWVNKPQKTYHPQKTPRIYKDRIHKRDGEYWFGDRPVKYLIDKARQQGLIVAPPDHSDHSPPQNT